MENLSRKNIIAKCIFNNRGETDLSAALVSTS